MWDPFFLPQCGNCVSGASYLRQSRSDAPAFELRPVGLFAQPNAVKHSILNAGRRESDAPPSVRYHGSHARVFARSRACSRRALLFADGGGVRPGQPPSCSKSPAPRRGVFESALGLRYSSGVGSRRAMTPDERRTRMAAIHREHTKPELVVRRALWRLGARYRLHAKELPGRPDVVMRPARKAVFVHGCLWHLHEGCPLTRVPRSRPDYWPAKLERNKNRDRGNLEELRRLGWSVEVVWECETRDQGALERRLRLFLMS